MTTTTNSIEELNAELGRDVRQIVTGLKPRHLYRSLRNAEAQEARKIRRAVISELSGRLGKGTGKLNARRDIFKSVTAKAFKSLRGFVVTVNHAGKGSTQGMYMTRHGLKPLALWANSGTTGRHGKGMQAMDFLRRGEALAPQAESNVIRQLDANVIKIIKKYGY